MLGTLDPAHLFAPLADVGPLLLAVSGGPDSMALMRLALQWPGRPDMSVATLDHGLRADSRNEAEQVARWASAAGLPHHLLAWDGEKPASRIHERAREARYRLLADCARRIGANALVTAHHADDQAETILLRLGRGSGIAGLAGMQPRTARNGVWLCRPLLETPKQALVTYCQGIGQAYFDDPTNADPIFARARLRQAAPALDRLGLSRDALLRLGARAARAEAALARAAAEFNAIWRADPSGGYPAAALAGQPDEIALRALAAKITAAGAANTPLRLERLEHLWARMRAAIAAGAPFSGTLQGVSLRLGRDGRLILKPEEPRRRGLRTPQN